MFGGNLMWQCLLSLLPIQLGIVQMSLNSSAILSHSFKVGTVLYIGCSIFQLALPDSHTVSFIVFFPTQKEYPKDTSDSPLARHQKLFFSDLQKCKEKWHHLRSNYMRERQRSEEKILGSGAKVKGK